MAGCAPTLGSGTDLVQSIQYNYPGGTTFGPSEILDEIPTGPESSFRQTELLFQKKKKELSERGVDHGEGLQALVSLIILLILQLKEGV